MIASIGTTHPWNIAGVGLDARVAAEYGLPHAMAVVAVTAQDALGLHDVHVVSPESVRAQLASLPRGPSAFRIGALVCAENVRIVAEFVRGVAVPVVVDPVVRVTLGGELRAGADLDAALRDELLALPVVVTPNLDEASNLLGRAINDVESMRSAAQALVARGAFAALVKGGHLNGDPVDVLATRTSIRTYAGERIAGRMRGCGCTLAAALACELALGRDLESAIDSARIYVRAKIAAGTMRGALQVAF